MGKHVTHDSLVKGFGDYLHKRGAHRVTVSVYQRKLTLLKMHAGREWEDIEAGTIDGYLNSIKQKERSQTVTAMTYFHKMIKHNKSLAGLAAVIGKFQKHRDPTILARYKTKLRNAALARRSIYSYLSAARSFLRWTEAEGRKLSDPKSPTDFLATDKADMTIGAFYSRRMTLRSFMDFLVSEGKIKTNPLGELNKTWAYERAVPWEQRTELAPIDPEVQRASMSIVPLAKVPEVEPDRSSPIYPLEREIEHLKNEIKRLTHALQFKDRVIEENLTMWRLGLDAAIWPTVGDALKLRQRLESALREDGARFTPEPSPQIEEKFERAFPKEVGERT